MLSGKKELGEQGVKKFSLSVSQSVRNAPKENKLGVKKFFLSVSQSVRNAPKENKLGVNK